MNWILEYYQAIESGNLGVSRRLKRVYEGLVNACKNPSDGYFFSDERADRVINFVERICVQSKGEWAGKPLVLQLWQKAYLSALFGLIDDKGNRKYRESLLLVGRKNGKSTMLAALCLYAMIADTEAGAEVYCMATKRAQAELIFEESCRMAKQSPLLSRMLKKRKTDLFSEMNFSKMKPLGKNSDTLDGLNCSLCVIDELHNIRDRQQYEVMRLSQSARRNPLLLSISTAGVKRESVFDDLYSYACNVADGNIDDAGFLPILYELDDKDEWKDPQNWIKANPSLGVTKRIDDLTAKLKRAAQNPRDLAAVLVYDFNIIGNSANCWLTYEQWHNPATFNLADFRGAYFIGGVDLSRVNDLTCASILLMDSKERKYCHQMYWLPADGFHDRVQREKVPYDKWQQAGFLRLCEGGTIRYSDITEWFLQLVQTYDLSPLVIGFDPFASNYWNDEMSAAGFRMEKVPQNAKNISLPMQHLQADLIAKNLNYQNNPILRWCLSNVGVSEDVHGNIMPVKANGAKNKIDGVSSLLDSYAGLYQHYSEMLNVAL